MTITYRPMPVAAGALAALRMRYIRRPRPAALARERATVSAWESEGGSLAKEPAPLPWF